MDQLTTEFRRRVAELGFELVDLRKRGSSRRPLVQARIDKPESRPGDGISVADCAVVSRALEAWLDADAVLGERYILEVSSPGIERPVRFIEDWRRFVGQEVNVKLAVVGRVRAKIVAVVDDGTGLVLRQVGEAENVTVPFDDASDATLAVDWN